MSTSSYLLKNDYPPNGLKLETKPYAPRQGMGIRIAIDIDPMPVQVNDRGDMARFNEPDNHYGMYVLSKTMDILSQKKKEASERRLRSDDTDNEEEEDKDDIEKTKSTAGLSVERTMVTKLFQAESKKMTNDMGMQKDHCTTYHGKYLHMLMRGFNTNDMYNPHLTELLTFFCKIRLGYLPFNLCELYSAMKAVQLHFLDKSFGGAEGAGPWTLPALHLLNGHLIARKWDRLNLRLEYEDDEQHAAPRRAEVSDTIWIKDKKVQVEKRPTVRMRMINFLKEVQGDKFVDPPTDSGAPQNHVAGTPQGNVKRMVVLPASGSSSKKRRRRGSR